jgi:hypothetical protein
MTKAQRDIKRKLLVPPLPKKMGISLKLVDILVSPGNVSMIGEKPD